MMVKLLLFFLFSLSAYAGQVPYDSSCVEMGKKWGWIKSYDPKVGYKREYQSWNVIKKDLANSKTQEKVIAQLSLWEEISKKAPCLKTYAGVRFEKGALYIDDMEKFRTFRLAKNLLECPQNYIDWDTREKKRRLEESYRGIDNTRTWVTSRQHNDAYDQILEEDKEAREKIFKAIQANNLMGDVGLENYCMGQLKTGILIDQARTTAEALNYCDSARKKGNVKVLSSSACTGYPAQIKKKIDYLKNSLDDVKKNEPGWQPLIRVTKADNDVYSQYKNDYAALLEAQKLATISLKNNYASDKYMLANDINSDINSVSYCSNREGEEAIAEQYKRGVKCGDYKTLTNLVTDFNTNIEVVKTLHRENLIEELNVHAFQEAMKSKYYLLDDNNPSDYKLKIAMYNGNNDPKVALKTCEALAGPDVCKGPYLEAYKKGTKEAATFASNTRHFLSYESKWLKDYYNERIEILMDFCDDYKFAQTNQLMTFTPGWENQFQTLMMQMTNGPIGPYLNLPSINGVARLSDFKDGKDYCKGFDGNHAYYLNEEKIDKAREEFKDATKKQIERTAEFSRSDRGSPSNIWGKKACDAPSMKMKNDMYALNSLYKSHAYLTGRVMTSMNPTEQKIYADVLCEAKNCDYQVESFNDDVSSAVKVLAIATNFIPYVGPFIYTGITAAIEVKDIVKDKEDAETDYDNLMGGVVSDGVDKAYTGSMGDLIKKLSHDKNPALMTDEIAKSILVNLVQLGVAQAVIRPLASKISRDLAVKLVKTRGFPMSKFEKDALEVVVTGGLVAVKEATKKGLNIGTKQSILDCIGGTMGLIVTVSATSN